MLSAGVSSLPSVRPARYATAATGPAAASDRAWDWLLVCVAGYVLTSVGRLHQLFPALDVFRPAMLTGGVAIVLYLFDQHEPRRTTHVWVSTTKYLLWLLAWMALSVPGALWPGNSFNLLFDEFIKTVVMSLVIAGSVRGVRDVERLVAAYFAAVAIYAGVVISRFATGAGETDWRLGHLYYYDANDFATLAVTALPFGLYLVFAARRRVVRWAAALGLAVITLAFVRSGSRGGFLALVVVGGYLLLRYTWIPLRWRVSAMALVVVILAGAATERYWEQMRTIASDADYNRTGETGRLQIWRRGLGYMLAFPLLGVGANNFPVAEGTLSPLATRQQLGLGVRWSAPHNSFLQVGVELGVPGLVFFSAVIGSAFGALRRTGRTGRGDRPRRRFPLTQTLTASLMGFVVGAFFLSLAYSDMLYTLVGLAIGLQKLAAERGAPFRLAARTGMRTPRARRHGE